jgi:hypothetical protein
MCVAVFPRDRGGEKSPGTIERLAEGTVQHDIDNLGRHLISVRWDIGITDYVFPSETEIIQEVRLA